MSKVEPASPHPQQQQQQQQQQQPKRHLLTLPTELLLLIIQFASSSPPPGSTSKYPTGLQTLINLSRTCKALHYTTFCPESDEAIWRHVAITRLGTHPALTLDRVTYSGLSAKRERSRKQRTWRDVVKLGVAWERPFPAREHPDGTIGPDGEWKVQKALRSFRPLPAPRGTEENGWGVEMVCPGDGDSRTQRFETKMPTGEGDEGRITFQVKRHEGGVRQQGTAAGAASEAKTRTVTAVVDLLGKGGARVGSRIRKGKGKSKVVCEEVKAGMGWTMTPYPGFSGLVALERERRDIDGNPVKTWAIKQVDSINGVLIEDKVWDLGGRRPDRFVGEGDVVVAICFEDPSSDISKENPSLASTLVCIERVVDKGLGWLGKGEAWRSRVRWEVDTVKEWAEESSYTAFAHLKNFHVTKYHLVALVTRHPTAYFHKLTGTFFYVIDLQTGKLVNKIKLRKRIPAPTANSAAAAGGIPPAPVPANNTTPAANAPIAIFAQGQAQATTPAAFTTAFNHDFLITDNFLVCGGPGGGLHVYNYTLCATPPSPNEPISPGGTYDDGNKPLYTLPDPWNPASPFYKHNPDLTPSIPTDTMQGMFVGRQFSGLTLSACGRYLGATTSDQFWVWDMIRKRLRGVWSNGRKVEKRDWYSRSPGDGWVGGVWVLLNYQDEDAGRGKLVALTKKRGRSLEKLGVGEDEIEEDEEIMVGYLTDLGIPASAPERSAEAQRLRLGLGFGIREGVERWRERWRRMEIDMMSTSTLLLTAVVLGMFAVVMAKWWAGAMYIWLD
ncbi:hypothetical protein BDZ91DRAFT_785969 [Kalaharituber pfeilii]|nr:hypothetical protein BDZ91DRAFT_785969 [Kalaharituber pfeilii]